MLLKVEMQRSEKGLSQLVARAHWAAIRIADLTRFGRPKVFILRSIAFHI